MVVDRADKIVLLGLSGPRPGEIAFHLEAAVLAGKTRPRSPTGVRAAVSALNIHHLRRVGENAASIHGIKPTSDAVLAVRLLSVAVGKPACANARANVGTGVFDWPTIGGGEQLGRGSPF